MKKLFFKKLIISYILCSLGAGLLGLFCRRLKFEVIFWDHFLVDYTIISMSGFILLILGLIIHYKVWKEELS